MKKRNNLSLLHVTYLSLALSLLGGTGQTAYAADTLTLERIYQTDKSNDDALDQFEYTFEKNGVIYGLKGVETEVIETIPTVQEQYLWESAVFIDGAEDHEPPREVEKEDGIYRLISKELLAGTAGQRSEYAASDMIYRLEYTDNLSEKGKVTVTDEDTGMEISRTLPLLKTEKTGTYWDGSFSFPVIVSDYDAEAFLLGNVRVPAGAPLIDYADELLKYLGLPGEYYRITAIEWSGEPYDKDGVWTREAAASGEKLITEVKATYGGSIELPALSGQYYKCTYAKEGTTTGMTYKIRAVATYEVEKDVVQHKSFLEWLLDWILSHPIAAVGIALLLIVLLIILILFILAKKEDREEEEEPDFEFSDENEEDE